jgi:hypothetical protein
MTKISVEEPEPGNLYDAWWQANTDLMLIKEIISGDTYPMERIGKVRDIVKDYGEKEVSKVDKYKCDHCGNETPDHYGCPGWVQIEMCRLHISNGRKNKGPAKNALVCITGTQKMDFCDVDCFTAWLNAKVKEGRAAAAERLEE